MPILIYYLIIALFTCATLSIAFSIKKNNQEKLTVFFKVFSLIFGFVFLFRYMWGNDAIQNVLNLGNSPFSSQFVCGVAIFLVWFTYVENILLSLYGFFPIKRINAYVKFISFPMAILNVALLTISFTAILGTNALSEYTIRGFIFAMEMGLALGYSLFILLSNLKDNKTNKLQKDNKTNLEKNTIIPTPIHISNNLKWYQKLWGKIQKISVSVWKFVKKYWVDFFVIVLLFASTMPSYTLQGLFGFAHQIYIPKEFEIPHRVIIYIGLILPVIIHFTLRNLDYTQRRFYLLFICLGTLLTFSMYYRFPSFADPTHWPLHLCHTAMYIMPIVLIFNMKRFFYFTYFINVLGAFFAILMPNISSSANIFSCDLINFFVNHYIAFFMPLLFVSLKMFEKPKIKQFIYSFIGFGGYFILVLFLNALYSGLYDAGLVASTTDFFFLNSDFIASKLGAWAENLRNITASFTINGVVLTFYPVYQVLFFLTYVALGFAIWFIYEQAYAIADSFADIKRRKEKIKLDKLALLAYLDGRSIKEPMKVENTNKLILEDFSKRYGNSDVFAVKNANLEVNGGEIFGFLGPNGAGKSTIIKTVVGIQPITSGRINVCGFDLDTQGVEARRNIGYVPDHYALYEKLTGREYINYIADLYEVPLKERTERIDNYVKRFELQNAFDNQMKSYSHGMKQKIAIMSALVHNPKVWILDEPLTGLDPNSIFQVKECMKEHAQNGNIVFFSSHIIDVVEKICDRIAIIKKGEILLTKSLEEIESGGDTLENFYMNTINGEEYLKQYQKASEELENKHIADNLADINNKKTTSNKEVKAKKTQKSKKEKNDKKTLNKVSKNSKIATDQNSLDKREGENNDND